MRQGRQRRRRRAAVATAAVAVAIVAGFLLPQRPDETASRLADAATASRVISPAQQTLPDGSIVDLKPGAEIAVGFSPASNGPRTVVLRRGTAHFQVAKDGTRPFVVVAGSAAFRAVGTAFTVEIESAAVELLVTEGRVAVETTGAAAASPSPTLADAGDRVVVNSAAEGAPKVTRLSEKDLATQLAWRVPRLEFNATSLDEAVAALNRHGGHRMRLASADLGEVAISGALRADAPGPLLEMLARNYRIETRTLPDGTIELHRAKER